MKSFLKACRNWVIFMGILSIFSGTLMFVLLFGCMALLSIIVDMQLLQLAVQFFEFSFIFACDMFIIDIGGVILYALYKWLDKVLDFGNDKSEINELEQKFKKINNADIKELFK